MQGNTDVAYCQAASEPVAYRLVSISVTSDEFLEIFLTVSYQIPQHSQVFNKSGHWSSCKTPYCQEKQIHAAKALRVKLVNLAKNACHFKDFWTFWFTCFKTFL